MIDVKRKSISTTMRKTFSRRLLAISYTVVRNSIAIAAVAESFKNKLVVDKLLLQITDGLGNDH